MPADPDAGRRFRLVIQAEGRHAVPAVYRLRSLLKVLLRGFGFKVIEAQPVTRDARAEEIERWLSW